MGVLPNGSNMIFGMNGNSLMAGGEYGTGGEAILPLNTLFDEMKDMFDDQNKSLVKALSSNNSSSPITLTLNVDGTTLAKTTVKNMKDLSRVGALDLEWL